MNKINAILIRLKEYYNIIKKRTICGYKWIGSDGLINLESTALLTIFFMLFFSTPMSVFLASIFAICKSINDFKNGHFDEKHDLICASMGIILGVLLGIM